MGANRRVDCRTMDGTVVGIDCYRQHKEKWLSLTINQLLDRGIILSYERVLIVLGFHISVNTYLHLRRCVSFALIKHSNNRGSDGSAIDIKVFLNKKNKGSKCFRLYISGARTCKVLGGNSIVTLCNLLGVAAPVDDTVRGKLLGTWNLNFWPSRIKVFLFQLYV